MVSLTFETCYFVYSAAVYYECLSIKLFFTEYIRSLRRSWKTERAVFKYRNDSFQRMSESNFSFGLPHTPVLLALWDSMLNSDLICLRSQLKMAFLFCTPSGACILFIARRPIELPLDTFISLCKKKRTVPYIVSLLYCCVQCNCFQQHEKLSFISMNRVRRRTESCQNRPICSKTAVK